METVREAMVSHDVIAYSLLVYLVVALVFDVGRKSLLVNLLVMFLVSFVFNHKSRVVLKMNYSYDSRKDKDKEGDGDDDDHVNLRRGAAGTPERAD